jgi:hypothetical protein
MVNINANQKENQESRIKNTVDKKRGETTIAHMTYVSISAGICWLST